MDVDSLIEDIHKCKGDGKQSTSQERVQAIPRLMEHAIVASMDTKQVAVKAKSVHFGTAKAKVRTRNARTAWTRKATASKLDPLLDKSNNPKVRQDHLSWDRLMHHHKIELFVSLNQDHWNRKSVEPTTCMECAP